MTPQVALSKDFMEAYSKLPRKIQKKVRDFTEKFRQDPTQSGLNFERIEAARDDKVRSVRIDQAYRAIVIHPPKGDVFLCAWVDHHDDAYAWAKNRRFEINPKVGTFQMFAELEEGESAVVAPSLTERADVGTGLFDSQDDEELLLAGVPEPLLAAVRSVANEDALDALVPHLPADAAEMLYLLAAGYSLFEAIEEADRAKPEPVSVDVEDFEAAFNNPASQQRFRIVGDEEALERMLDAPLAQWRVFLHASQEKLVRMNANGPVRVLGSAGTGKTVVLMHRANYLASEVFTEETDRILVTTFTRNLAFDLSANLKTLCDRSAFARLDVNNLHSWAVGFMRSQGHSFKVVAEHESDLLFEAAVAERGDEEWPLSFYAGEWKDVVQPQAVASRDDYLTARRVGRGVRLSRKQRAQVWPVLERYRELLDEKHLVEWSDVIRETRLYIENYKVELPYKAVLCDEAQDLDEQHLKLLRTLAPQAPNSLLLVGDGHQRIYGQPVRFGACGIEIRGRSRRLKINYRTTEQIRDHAVAVLEGREIDDLDGGVDRLDGSFSLRHGPQPQVRMFDRDADEAAFVVETVKRWLKEVPAEGICIAARTREQIRTRYVPILEGAGLDVVVVEKDPVDTETLPGIRIATMHRLKGLEFSRMLLAGVQEGTMPLRVTTPGMDDEGRTRQELQERCLLYVAATRARDALVVVGYGEPSPFLLSA